MLILKNIVKDYVSGDTVVHALRDVGINFRENEFVSILGPSGSGKTTLLNIIGGLDRYTSGDLIINGKSTKDFTDNDWDTYRNHSIGFIFQSYNLISHQTVLSNVELALTLSGVSKKERRERAVKALVEVGLKDQINKKPSQLSGGQMQRVAIARAIVNNPDILLADEPTGSLDTETSLQVMETIKNISKDKLVIMVTHNPELAHKYSSRILSCLDGEMINDTNPFEPDGKDRENEKKKRSEEEKKGRKPSMSTKTAFSLSLKNLVTKKARTFLTAFAGSIGIIGIALVLALSNGIEKYIDKVQNDLLLAVPATIEREAIDMNNVMGALTDLGKTLLTTNHDLDNIYVNSAFADMVQTFVSQSTDNNIKSFRKYIEDNKESFTALCNDIQYKYDTPLNIYKADTENGIIQVNPNTMISSLMSSTANQSSAMASMQTSFTNMFSSSAANIWAELIGDNALIEKQYEIIKGRLPENKNEVVLIVDKNNEINELVMYALGIKNQANFMEDIMDMISSDKENKEKIIDNYTYEDILNMKFKLVFNYQFFTKNEKTKLWENHSNNVYYMKQLIDNGEDISIVGILRPDPHNVLSTGIGIIGFRTDLMEYAIQQTLNSEIVQEQLNNPKTDVLSGHEFSKLTVNDFSLSDIDLNLIDFKYLDLTPFISLMEGIDLSKIDILNLDIRDFIDFSDMTQLKKKLMEGFLTDEQVLAFKRAYIETLNAGCSIEKTFQAIGYSTEDSPTSIYLYAKNFEAKDKISEMVKYYNDKMLEEGRLGYTVTLTDYIGMVMGSITNILNIVTYVLVAFVAISLVVSSIMIGIITYISVLERTKEIGILRSIGASKGDIAKVFNAETIAIGFGAGIIGIVTTLLLEIPINIFLEMLTHTGAAAALPFIAGVILVLISIMLTFIAGLVPSSIAANKDPVLALGTE